jgi:hypothetical protein
MKHGSMYGHKGMSGAYGKSKASSGGKLKAINGKNPFAYRKMARAKEVKASHKGHA